MRKKMDNEIKDELDAIKMRVDSIENLLRLLLVNSLMDTEVVLNTIDLNCFPELYNAIEKYGVNYGGFKQINELDVVLIEIPDDVKLKAKELCCLYFNIKEIYPDVEPVLMFKTINGMQRKRIIQEELSFGVHRKELHIMNRGNK